MSKYNTKGYYDDPEEDDEDYYSPTDWDKGPFESDEDYEDRIQDQEDYLDSFN